jgi:hypothetical protein
MSGRRDRPLREPRADQRKMPHTGTLTVRSTARASLSSLDVFSIQRSTAALVVIHLRPTLRPGSSLLQTGHRRYPTIQGDLDAH